MPLTLGIIGAGVGLGKSALWDQPQAARDRTLAAETQRYSPWTGLKAQPIKEADPIGQAATFGLNGAALGQNIQDAKAQDALNASMANYYNKGGMGSIPNKFSGLQGSKFWSAPNAATAFGSTTKAAPATSPWGLLGKDRTGPQTYSLFGNTGGGSSY